MTERFENVTLVFKGQDFGFGLTCVPVKWVEIEHRPYAQYNRATQLTFRQARQRKDRRTVLYSDQHLVVAEGRVEFNNFAPAKRSGSGVTCLEGKYSACDPAWGDELDALADRLGDRVVYRQDKHGDEPEPEDRRVTPDDLANIKRLAKEGLDRAAENPEDYWEV